MSVVSRGSKSRRDDFMTADISADDDRSALARTSVCVWSHMVLQPWSLWCIREIRRIECFRWKNVVPPSKFFDLFTHHRPVLPAIVQIHVHRSPPSNRDQRLRRVEESRSGLSDRRHTNAHVKLQEDEEDEEDDDKKPSKVDPDVDSEFEDGKLKKRRDP